MVRPHAGFLHGLAEEDFGEAAHQADIFGGLDEQVRADAAKRRAVPARQRFQAAGMSGVQVKHGLELDAHFTFEIGMAKRLFEGAAGKDQAFMLVREEDRF